MRRDSQDDRVRIRRPRRNLQVKLTRALSTGDEFVSYIDAIGELDGTPCLIDWKTTTSRYPKGLVSVERDGWRCQFCGSLASIEVHHLEPRSRLGDDREGNLITLCAACHRTVYRACSRQSSWLPR